MAPLLRCRSSRDGSPASHASPASPPRLAFRCPTSRRTVRPAVEFRILGPLEISADDVAIKAGGRSDGDCSRIHRLQLREARSGEER
jgi:hypothetical protein